MSSLKRFSLLTAAFMSLVLIGSEPANAATDWRDLEKAQYEVPVPAHLKHLAFFPLTDLKEREKDGLWQLHYTLPLELTGRKVEIQVTTPAGNKTVGSGANSKMVCQPNQCALTYNDLNLTKIDVENYLRSLKMSDIEIGQRLEVFQHFVSGDPAGVIHFNY